MADNDANLYKYRLKHICHPLIDGHKWFLISKSLMKRSLLFEYSRKPKPENTKDFDGEAVKFKIVGWWAYGFLDYLWIFGANYTG